VSTSAVNGEDAIGFYAAAIRETHGPTLVGVAGVDVGNGTLVPGRYIVQVWNLTPGGICWIIQESEDADPAAFSAAAGRRRFPLGPVFSAIETQVRAKQDNRLIAICSAGATAEVVVSRVSEGNAS